MRVWRECAIVCGGNEREGVERVWRECVIVCGGKDRQRWAAEPYASKSGFSKRLGAVPRSLLPPLKEKEGEREREREREGGREGERERGRGTDSARERGKCLCPGPPGMPPPSNMLSIIRFMAWTSGTCHGGRFRMGEVPLYSSTMTVQ